MGILNKFFGSPESQTEEIVKDDAALIAMWKGYVESTKEKGKLIIALKTETSIQNIVQSLKNVISSELVKTIKEKKTEQELIADLQSVEHQENIRRIKSLEYTIGYAATKHKYIYRLLQELWMILNQELHIVELLSTKSKNEAHFIKKLQELWELEQHIITQINQRETFHQLFVDLMKGTHKIQQLQKQEKRAISLMDKMIDEKEGVLRAWFYEVFKAISDKVTQAIADGTLEAHQDADFEFVNSQQFVALVREIVIKIRPQKEPASEATITAFVHSFRDWYNSQWKG